MRGLMTEQPKSEDRVQRLKPLTDFYGEDRHELVQKVAYQLWGKRSSPIARTSVMGYKHKDARLDQIGRDLSVQYVLENSLRESGDHIRLTSQLIQMKDQTHLWARDYDYRRRIS